MTNESSELIDLDLVDKVVSFVPEHAWDFVTGYFIDQLVDNMPSTVLETLTGDPCGFDRAEEILADYYAAATHQELIIDAFKILGAENALYMMDSWQLDKIQKPNDICTTASTSLSTVQEEQPDDNRKSED